MSGLEVAGVALAAFPILINGLLHIVDGIETAKRWMRYRAKLKDYANVVETARICFLNTLEELLGDIVAEDDEVAMLLEDPGGLRWKSPEYEEPLRKRLDRSYNAYINTVSMLVGALQAVCERLGVDDAGAVLIHDFWDQA